MGDEERAPLTWAQVRGALQAVALERDEWAGYPLPIRDFPLRLNPRQPMAAMLQGAYFEGEKIRGRDEESAPSPTVRNEWYSHRYQARVMISEVEGHLRVLMAPAVGTRNTLTINTLGVAASPAWTAEAEFTAMEKLQALITPHAWTCYVLTGGFLESSDRSGVTYFFRKLRPTLALKATADRSDTKILAALCLHPIGYYEGTWGGVMVPTDDVIAHLTLMRGDEADFWRQANQHPAWAPEAGI